jgi:hypothetical protein
LIVGAKAVSVCVRPTVPHHLLGSLAGAVVLAVLRGGGDALVGDLLFVGDVIRMALKLGGGRDAAGVDLVSAGVLLLGCEEARDGLVGLGFGLEVVGRALVVL